jgi:hypothetical protein
VLLAASRRRRADHGHGAQPDGLLAIDTFYRHRLGGTIVRIAALIDQPENRRQSR